MASWLRRSRATPPRNRSDPSVLLLQSADPDRYAEMLALSRSVNELYARRHGFHYRSHLGILRGCYPWHATFNRIPLLGDLVDTGYRGWVFYLDADAYVVDLAFDLKAYLRQHRRHWLIAASGGSGGWNINAGVLLIDLGRRRARRLVRLWRRDFLGVSEHELAMSPRWGDIAHDQDRLQGLLKAHPAWLDGLHIERDALNEFQRGRFVRQAIRGSGTTLQSRLDFMRADIEALGIAPPRALEPGLERLDAQGAQALASRLHLAVRGRPADPEGLERYTAIARSQAVVDAVEAVTESLLAEEASARGSTTVDD